MTFGEIEHAEERLVGARPIAPVRLAAGHVPGILRCLELVVRLRIIRAEITGLSQSNGERQDGIWERGRGSHVLRPDRGLIHARDNCRPAGRTDASRSKGVRVSDAFGR